MAERRQAHRRESIEVEVRDRVLEAHPLPWMKRNDLGNEVMRQYSEVLNSQLRAYTDKSLVSGPDGEGGFVPQLHLYINDKIQDPESIVQIGYPGVDLEFLHILEYAEILELIYASLDVNLLHDLKDLVDPNALAPTTNGGNDSPGMESPPSDTPSQLPTPDSSSQESVEKKSSSLPSEKSSTSSTSKTESSGTSDGGS